MRALPWLALLATLSLPFDDDEPLPAGVAARIDGEVVTLDEYGRYLVELYGRRPLQELIVQRLLRREGARLGIDVTEAELTEWAGGVWRGFVDVRHHGDEERATAELADQGYTPGEFLAGRRLARERELLQRRLCRATREVTEAAVKERFDREHGVGGVRVEVRHIHFNRSRLESALRKAGVPAEELTPAALDARMRESADELVAQIAADADMGALARRVSHDLSAKQNDGLIPGYNYRRYGEAFAVAVRAAEVGEVVGPVASDAGVHVLRVESRVVTKLEDVRAEIEQAVRDAEPSPQEIGALIERLRAAAKIRTY